MRKMLVLCLSLVFSICKAQQPTEVSSLEAVGNLQATQPIGCVKLSKLTSSHTPADLYPGIRKCIDDGDYEEAAYIFVLAGTYGYFDMLRVADRTAHQAIAVLRNNILGSVEKSSADAFQNTLKEFLTDKRSLSEMCKKIKSIGQPTYYPAYMIQHGMGSFFENKEQIVDNFDAMESWIKTLDEYLHCSK